MLFMPHDADYHKAKVHIVNAAQAHDEEVACIAPDNSKKTTSQVCSRLR